MSTETTPIDRETRETRETWLRRVRNMLAKAEDAACTPEESEAFTAKATEMMAKYGIDQALIEAQEPVRRSTPTSRWFTMDGGYSKDSQLLLSRIAGELGCRVVLFSGRSSLRKLHMFGFESDLDRAEILYTSLLVQQANGLAQAVKPWGEDTVSFKKSFMSGFTHTVVERIAQAEERARSNAQQNQTPGRPSVELVLADRGALVEAAMQSEYPKLGKPRPRRLRSRSGMDQGNTAGSRADIGGTRVTAASSGRGLSQA